MNSTKDQTRYFILMVIAMLFWGIAWTAGKAAAEHSNAQVAAFWRYGVSFLAIIPLVRYFKTPFKSDAKGYGYMFLAVVLFNSKRNLT